MKALKWVLGLAAAGVAAVVVGAVLLVWLVDPNEYKPWIERRAHELTGRELRIEGDLELTVFPWLGTRVEGVTLSNAPGFGDAPMLEVGLAQVRVALMPLLRGELRADEVVLERARIRLARDQHGRANWEDLLEAFQTEPSTEEASEPQGGAPPFGAVMIGGVRVEDAALYWSDARSGTTVEVVPLELRTGSLEPGRPVDASLRGTIRTGEPAAELDVGLKAKLEPQPEGRYLLDPMRLELTAEGAALEGRRVKAALEGPVELAPEGPRVRASGLRLDVLASGEGLPRKGVTLSLRTDLDSDLQPGKGRLQMTPLQLEVDEVSMTGELHASGLPERPEWRLQLESGPFDPRALLERWGITVQTAEAEALRKARFEISAQGGTDAVTLRSVTAVLDETRLQASGSVRGFGKPAIRFEAEIDALDVDRYLSPVSEEAGADARPGAQGAPADDRLGLPIEALRDLDLEGKLRIGRVKVSGLRMQDLSARLRARGGKVAVEPFGLALYGGKVEGGAESDVSGRTPRFTAHLDVRSVAVGDLLADMKASAAAIRGKGALTAKLHTRGDRVPELKRALGGDVSFSLVDGALRDPKLARTLEHVIAFLEDRPPRPAGEEILFESVRATGKIREGVLQNDDLEMITPLILAKGAGTVDIGADTVDYVLRVALATGGKARERTFVPITVKGPLGDLEYGLDLKSMARDRLLEEAGKRIDEQVGQEIGKQLEQVAPGAGGAVGEVLKKGLGGFLGR